jgi:hypothetical protein
VIDDREGVIFGETVAWRLHELGWVHLSQFRNPVLDILAGRIVVFGLTPRILNPEIGSGVGSGSGGPLPAPIVGGDIPVHQFLHKILFTFLPVEVQIFGQEHGHDHPDPVMHETGRAQLSHSGIDDRETGATFTPTLKNRLIFVPLQGSELVVKVLI